MNLYNNQDSTLAEDIQTKISDECFDDHTIYVNSFQIESHFECMAGGLGNVSKRHGLENLWSMHEAKFQDRFDGMNECKHVQGQSHKYL